MTRRRVATLGRLSMAAGSALMVVGLSIRGGVLGVVAGGGPSSAAPSPTAIALAATQTLAVSGDPSHAPESAAPATPLPADPMLTVFEDSFEVEGAWPDRRPRRPNRCVRRGTVRHLGLGG